LDLCSSVDAWLLEEPEERFDFCDLGADGGETLLDLWPCRAASSSAFASASATRSLPR
jgi:hypothetical protein